MGIEYYAFAFYVFILVCIIILLCRAVFSRYKKQKMLFDEKEAKLLKLYQTVEDAMDEFFDMAAESKSEMDEALRKLSSMTGVAYKNVGGLRQQRSIPDVSEHAGIVSGIGGDLTAEEADGAGQLHINRTGLTQKEETLRNTSAASDSASFSRNDAILRLFRCGKTRAQIAQELNITQNEVDLIIGMNKNIL